MYSILEVTQDQSALHINQYLLLNNKNNNDNTRYTFYNSQVEWLLQFQTTN